MYTVGTPWNASAILPVSSIPLRMPLWMSLYSIDEHLRDFEIAGMYLRTRESESIYLSL